MPVDQKILDRINKLIRLASPQTNDNEHERTSAALELAEIMAKNNLTAAENAPPERKPRHHPRAGSTKKSPPPGDWVDVVVTQNTRCAACWKTIPVNDAAWFRFGAYVHHGCEPISPTNGAHPRHRPSPSPPSPPSPPTPLRWENALRSAWRDVRFDSEEICTACSRAIPAGEIAWYSPIHGVRCHNITCYEA